MPESKEEMIKKQQKIGVDAKMVRNARLRLDCTVTRDMGWGVGLGGGGGFKPGPGLNLNPGLNRRDGFEVYS